jgi:hypothetical protein
LLFLFHSKQEETTMAATLQQKINLINARLRSFGIEAVQEIKMTGKDGKVITVEINLFEPIYRPVSIDAEFYVWPGEPLENVRSRIEAALADFFSFDRVSFGQTMHFSDLVALIDGARGVSHMHLYAPQQDIELRHGEIPVLGSVNQGGISNLLLASTAGCDADVTLAVDRIDRWRRRGPVFRLNANTLNTRYLSNANLTGERASLEVYVDTGSLRRHRVETMKLGASPLNTTGLRLSVDRTRPMRVSRMRLNQAGFRRSAARPVTVSTGPPPTAHAPTLQAPDGVGQRGDLLRRRRRGGDHHRFASGHQHGRTHHVAGAARAGQPQRDQLRARQSRRPAGERLQLQPGLRLLPWPPRHRLRHHHRDQAPRRVSGGF